jgi:hypothetical protein
MEFYVFASLLRIDFNENPLRYVEVFFFKITKFFL